MPLRYHRRCAAAAVAFVFIVVIVITAATTLLRCHRWMPPPRYRCCRCHAARCHCPTAMLPATAALPAPLPRRCCRRRAAVATTALSTSCHCHRRHRHHRTATALPTAMLPLMTPCCRSAAASAGRSISAVDIVFWGRLIYACARAMYMNLFYLTCLPGGRARPLPLKGWCTLRPPLLKTLYLLLCTLRWLREDAHQDLLANIKLYKNWLLEVLIPCQKYSCLCRVYQKYSC
jgi:hypothetical protein